MKFISSSHGSALKNWESKKLYLGKGLDTDEQIKSVCLVPYQADSKVINLDSFLLLEVNFLTFVVW